MSIPAVRDECVLYDYQDALVGHLRESIRTGQYPVILWAPCGAGKGTLATYMIQRSVANGFRVLFLVNRRGLVHDQSRRLDRLGLDHGIIMSGVARRKPWLNVHIASIDTLARRDTVPPADLIFIDECHFSVSPTWRKIIDRYAGVPIIGMTATPARLDGRGLGEIYKRIIYGPSTRWLIEQGKLSPMRVFAPTAPDTSKVDFDRRTGDLNQKQLATVMDRKKLIGDTVDHWKRIARGHPTVLFGVNRKHAQHACEQFKSAGVRAEYADGEMPDADRDALWGRLARYETEIACTVGIVSYGWDVPEVACAIDLKPTESITDWLQRVGRIQRFVPGKTAIYLDHAGNTARHGFSDDDRQWTLDGAVRKPRDRDAALSIRMCPECWAAFSSTLPTCPHCGWQYVSKAKPPEVVPGELTEITSGSRPVYTIRKLSHDPEIARLQKIAAERGYSPGWVWHSTNRVRENRERAIRAEVPRRVHALFSEVKQ